MGLVQHHYQQKVQLVYLLQPIPNLAEELSQIPSQAAYVNPTKGSSKCIWKSVMITLWFCSQRETCVSVSLGEIQIFIESIYFICTQIMNTVSNTVKSPECTVASLIIAAYHFVSVQFSSQSSAENASKNNHIWTWTTICYTTNKLLQAIPSGITMPSWLN